MMIVLEILSFISNVWYSADSIISFYKLSYLLTFREEYGRFWYMQMKAHFFLNERIGKTGFITGLESLEYIKYNVSFSVAK